MKTEMNENINYPIMMRSKGYEYIVFLFTDYKTCMIIYSSNKNYDLFKSFEKDINSTDIQFLPTGERITFIQPPQYKAEK